MKTLPKTKVPKRRKVCESCGHPIKKRHFVQGGWCQWEWVHTEGGRYCKRTVYDKGLPLGKCCFCNKPELKEEEAK